MSVKGGHIRKSENIKKFQDNYDKIFDKKPLPKEKKPDTIEKTKEKKDG